MNKLINNILNEGQPAQLNQQPAHSAAFESSMKDTFITNCKRDNIAIDIKLPTSFKKPISFPAAPQDLKNLLKPEKFADKFVNGHGMMADPVSTFKAASDYGLLCFKNTDSFKKSLDDKKGETFGGGKKALERGHEHDHGAHEALQYGDYEVLNEVVGEAAVLGAKTGAAVGVGANAIAGATLGFGAGFAALVAPLAAGLYGAGYAGGKMLDNTKGTHLIGTTNTADVENSNDQTKLAHANDIWEGDNVIEAIDKYLEDLAESLDSLIAYIDPDAKSDFVNTIENYKTSDISKLKEYIHQNTGIIKQIDDEIEAKREKRAKYILNESEKIVKFGNAMTSMLANVAPEDIPLYQKVINIYGKSGEKNFDLKLELEMAASDGWDAIKKVANDPKWAATFKNVKATPESQIISYESPLFEGEQPGGDRPLIDGTEHYEDLKTKFRTLARETWPKTNKSQGIEQCKTIMQKLKEGCDKEIKDKIQLVCRTTNDGSATTMSDKVVSFFSKHPMQSKYLENLWNRHSSELDIRMNNRLDQMRDFSDKTRVAGWLAYIFKNTVPDVLARVFTMRYVISILHEQGVYTYTPELFKEDEQLWEDNKDSLMQNINLMVLMYFVTMGKNFTGTDNSFVEISQDGGYVIDKNNAPEYISFLMINCTKMNGMQTSGMRTIAAFARIISEYIANNEIADADKFVEVFLGAIDQIGSPMSEYVLNGMGAEDVVLDNFRNVKLLNDVKSTIDETFTTITGYTDIKNEVASQSHKILQSIPEKKKNIFFEHVTSAENFSKLTELKSKYDEAKESNSKEAARIADEAKALIKGCGVDLPNIKDGIELMDFNKELKSIKTDKYSFIYSVFAGKYGPNDEFKGLNIASMIKGDKGEKKGVDKDAIESICSATKKYLLLITSGVLTIGNELSLIDIEINELRDAYESIESNSLKDLRKLFTICAQATSDPQQIIAAFNNATNNPAIKVEKIVDTIHHEIENANANAAKQFDSPDFGQIDGSKVPNMQSFEKGVFDGVNNLDELFNADDSEYKILDVEKIPANVYLPLLTTIEYAITKSLAYDESTIEDYIKENTTSRGTVIDYIRFWADNKAEADTQLKEVSSTDPNDPIIAQFNQLFAEMQKQFINSYNSSVKDFPMEESLDIWELFKLLRQSNKASTLISNIGSIKFGGDELKNQADKQYEITLKLLKFIAENISTNEAWAEFEKSLT